MHTENNQYYRIYINPTDLAAIIPHIKPYFISHF